MDARSAKTEFGAAKRHSVGRALPDTQLRIVDADTGAEVPAGQQGLLEAKVAPMGPDWIRTTDIASIDDDGFVTLHGRADGAIRPPRRRCSGCFDRGRSGTCGPAARRSRHGFRRSRFLGSSREKFAPGRVRCRRHGWVERSPLTRISACSRHVVGLAEANALVL